MALRFPIDFPNNTPVLLADQVLINASGTNTTSFSTIAQVFTAGILLTSFDVGANNHIDNAGVSFFNGGNVAIGGTVATFKLQVTGVANPSICVQSTAGTQDHLLIRAADADQSMQFINDDSGAGLILSLKRTGVVNIDIGGVGIFANNAAAIGGGLVAGDIYRTGANPDVLCIVH